MRWIVITNQRVFDMQCRYLSVDIAIYLYYDGMELGGACLCRFRISHYGNC